MNKKFQKLIALTLVLLSFVFVMNTGIVVFAQANPEVEKVYCKATTADDFSDNEILVALNKQKSRQLQSTVSFDVVDCLYVEDLTSSFDTEEEMKENFRRIFKITLRDSGKEKVLENIRKLEKIRDVYCAVPNYYVKFTTESVPTQVTPNDTYASSQYAIEDMNLNDAWRFSTGNSGVTVGIIDSGIDVTHPDLQANINTSLSRCFVEDLAYPLDDVDAHGTHVAGIVGAVGSNNLGITGVNWDVSLVSFRVATADGTLSLNGILNAINYANSVNIDVLNLSGGIKDLSDDGFSIMYSIIDDYSGLFVCAAGNDGKNTDTNPYYPSCLDLPNLISVGSLDEDGDISDFSNYGTNTVQVYAPGKDICSTYPCELCENSVYTFSDGTRFCEFSKNFAAHVNNYKKLYKYSWTEVENNFRSIAQSYFIDDEKDTPIECRASVHKDQGYHSMSGTSMSSPQVAGVAALLLSINPNLTATQLKSCILNSAKTITINIPNGTQSVKKLDAFGAVKQAISASSATWVLRADEHSLSETINGDSTYFANNNAMIKLDVFNEGNYKFVMSAPHALSVTLYDSNLDVVAVTPTYSNGNCNVNFTKDFSRGTYYLMINFVDATDSGTVSISVSHTHTYSEWEYYNNLYHVAACKCGVTKLSNKRAHAVNRSQIVNNYAPCVDCHHMINLRYDQSVVDSISNLKVSINGSYIYPSGVVVLVDADVESYYNGTLRFYDRNELPQCN